MTVGPSPSHGLLSLFPPLFETPSFQGSSPNSSSARTRFRFFVSQATRGPFSTSLGTKKNASLWFSIPPLLNIALLRCVLFASDFCSGRTPLPFILVFFFSVASKRKFDSSNARPLPIVQCFFFPSLHLSGFSLSPLASPILPRSAFYVLLFLVNVGPVWISLEPALPFFWLPFVFFSPPAPPSYSAGVIRMLPLPLFPPSLLPFKGAMLSIFPHVPYFLFSLSF